MPLTHARLGSRKNLMNIKAVELRDILRCGASPGQFEQCFGAGAVAQVTVADSLHSSATPPARDGGTQGDCRVGGDHHALGLGHLREVRICRFRSFDQQVATP